MLSNEKTLFQTFIHIIFQDFTLGDIIKDSYHHFDFGDTNNDPFNIDPTGKDNYTNGIGNDAMIIISYRHMEGNK